MKKSFILNLLIGIMLLGIQAALAEGTPQISLSPSNGQVFEGGTGGYGKTINISYSVSNLESCWWHGEWTGFEIWVSVDGNVISYYRDPERPAFFNYYALTYSSSIDHYFSQGSHTIQVHAKSFEVKFDLYLDIDESYANNTIQINPPPSITADNNFTDVSGVTHGSIIVSGYGTKTAPFIFEKNSGHNVSLTAVSPQNNNAGYQMIWHTGVSNKSEWKRNGYPLNFYGQTYSFTVTQVDNNATYQAQLRKICNFTLSNQLPGTAETGEMKLNGVTYTAPVAAYPVVEQNEVAIEAKYNYDFGGDLFWRFNRWSDGGSSPSFYYTATQHKSFTAEYKRVPVFTEGRYRNLSLSFPGHGSLRLSWDEHPNTGVTQYQIWKQVYFINGVHQTTEPYLLATVNRGTTSYTDITVQQLPGEDLLVLGYDVKAYYQSDGTVSDPNFREVSAYTLDQQNKEIAQNNVKPEVTEYSVTNYPNPFNPSTRINYSIKEDGFVSIRVYNLLGKEIAALVNEPKTKGNYSVEFSVGSVGNASALPSGVYIYTINVNDYFSAKKIILSK